MSQQNDTTPWAADRSLDDEAALSIIASQFPELKPARITGRYEGFDNQAVEVNGNWIFRFPKRADYVSRFRTELALLKVLGPQLPVATPEYRFFGEPASEFPYIFAGYRKVEGMAALDFTGGDLPMTAIAASLAEILRAIHSFPLDQAHSLGVQTAGDGTSAVSDAIVELEAVKIILDPAIYGRCRDYLLANIDFRRPVDLNVLLHSDFSAEHVLLSPNTGHVSGLIDWTDAEIGDPAFDFGYLWSWRGDAFVTAIYDAYADVREAGFLERARLYGVLSAVADLHYGFVSGLPRYKASGLQALTRLAERD